MTLSGAAFRAAKAKVTRDQFIPMKEVQQASAPASRSVVELEQDNVDA